MEKITAGYRQATGDFHFAGLKSLKNSSQSLFGIAGSIVCKVQAAPWDHA